MKRVRFGQRTILLVLVVVLLVNPLLIVPARAQTSSVAMTKEEWAQTIWMADWVQRYQGDERIKAAWTTWVLVSLFQSNPNLTRDEAVHQITEYNKQFQEQIMGGQSWWEASTRTIAEIGLKGINALGPLGGPGGEAAAGLLDTVNSLIWAYQDNVNREAAVHKMYDMREHVKDREQWILHNAFELALQNPEFAYAYNATFRPEVDIEDALLDPAPLIANNPTLLPQTIKQRIVQRPDGSILIALNDVKAAVSDNTALLNQVIDNQQALAQQIDQLQQDFHSYIKEQEKREIAKQLADAQAQVDALKLKAATSGVYIVSTLIGVADPKLGRQVSVVGNAGIDIAQSMIDYTDTMSKLGELLEKGLDGKVLDLASSLGAVVLTGNILAAVMNVISIFQESGPTDEQLILQQVGQLRQQVEDVRQQMHQRFDRIDAQLNRIYGDMMNEFALISLSQWQIRDDIHDIQTHLMDIEMDLHAIEAQMSEWVQDGANSRLYERINYAIGYKERFPVPMEATTYYDYQNTFYHWATQESKNSINAGADLPIEEYTNPDRSLVQLSRPLDERINYLAAWLPAHGLPSFTDRRLANPQIWALSTRTYTQMKYDWPDLAAVHDPNKVELTQIRQVGADLSNAIRSITTITTAQGPRANHPLFDGLTGYYTSTVSGLESALQSVENNYVQELLITSLKHPSNLLDFWSGANQSIPYLPSNLWCNHEGMAAPSTLLAWIPAPYLVRNYLTPQAEREQGATNLESCWRAFWADERFVTNPNGSESYFAKLQVEVYVQYEDKFVSIVYTKGNEEGIGSCNGNVEEPVCYFHDPEEIVTNNWTDGRNYKALLESNAAPLPISEPEQQARATLLAQVISQVEQSLHTHQKGIYQAILASLNQATDQRTAARKLEAARLVLVDLLRLGMPRALTTDEYLRSFLEGDSLKNHQRLFGEEMISNWYSAAYLSLLKDEGQILSEEAAAMVEWYRAEVGEQPLTLNPRTMLRGAIFGHTTLLNEWLEEYFDLVDEGVYKDSEPLIEMTLLQLEVYDNVGRFVRPSPEPTATPPATPTVTATVTASPTATDPSATPTSTATATPTSTATPTVTATVTAPPTATNPSATPTSTTATATPTSPETPISTATPTPVVTSTPSPQPTQEPNDPLGTMWIMPDAGGQLVGNAGMEIRLNFPPGSYPEPFELRLEPLGEAPATAGRSLLGQIFSIVAFDAQHNAVTHFAKPYTMVIRYAHIAALDEEQLALYFWDDSNEVGKWVAVPTEVDSANNTMTATLDHLTIFASMVSERLLYLPSVQTSTQPTQR